MTSSNRPSPEYLWDGIDDKGRQPSPSTVFLLFLLYNFPTVAAEHASSLNTKCHETWDKHMRSPIIQCTSSSCQYSAGRVNCVFIFRFLKPSPCNETIICLSFFQIKFLMVLAKLTLKELASPSPWRYDILIYE